MPYRFDVAGESWTSEDYTLDQMVAVEKRCGYKWSYVDPVNEAEAARACIIEWYAAAADTTDAAEKRAGALTARQVRIVAAEDDRPIEHRDGIPVVDPKAAAAEPETT